MKVLVVAAHPDDEVLGCGATIAKHVDKKDTVWVLILGEGLTSRFSRRDGKVKLLKKLWACSQKANQVLGVERLIQKGFPDNAFDSVPRLKVIRVIEGVVRQFEPEVLYTHSQSDLNIDHQICCESVQTACRPLPGCPVRKILAFEVPSSTEWRFHNSDGFRPNLFNDISEFLSKKLEAIRQYDGELRPFPHPRSIEHLRALAQVRGSQSGFRAAEAFCLLREAVL